MPAEPVPSPSASGDVPPNWTSSTERTADAFVVRLAGELDYPGIGQLETLLDAELADAPPALVLDLTGVAFCDSSSLQVLLRTSTRARDMGVAFALAGARRAVVRPIQLLGLAEHLPAYETVDAALGAV